MIEDELVVRPDCLADDEAKNAEAEQGRYQAVDGSSRRNRQGVTSVRRSAEMVRVVNAKIQELGLCGGA